MTQLDPSIKYVELSRHYIRQAEDELSVLYIWLHDVDIKMSLSSVHDVSLNLSSVRRRLKYCYSA